MTNQPLFINVKPRMPSPATNGAVRKPEPQVATCNLNEHQERSIEMADRPWLNPQTHPFTAPNATLWAKSVPGWMTPDELNWLSCEAGKLPEHGSWLEVGTWRGRSASAVILSLPHNAVFRSIDSWCGTTEIDPASAGTPDAALAEWTDTSQQLKRLREDVMIITQRMTSLAAAITMDDELFDTVFIDGAHDYKSAKDDILAWLPKVKPGGMICGHDRADDGAHTALTEIFPDGHGEGPGSIWYVRLKKDLPLGVIDTLAMGDRKIEVPI
jgi:predicted O-methyltransferase YrrM